MKIKSKKLDKTLKIKDQKEKKNSDSGKEEEKRINSPVTLPNTIT